MPRKIRAKTLGKLLTRYFDDFPAECVECVKEEDAAAGAELLALLPEDRAWALLRLLPSGAAKLWLRTSGNEALLRLLRHVHPDSPPDPQEERSALDERALAALTPNAGAR